VALAEVIDEHVLQRYRELLDDRDRFDADLAAWRQAVQRRLVFLPRLGVEVPAPVRA